MADIPVFHGHVVLDRAEVRLVLLEDERPGRQRYLQTLIGLPVDVVVKEHRDRRSERANAYYWGCVLAPMSKDGSDGDQSPEEIHDAMCEMFLPNEKKRVEFFNRMTGECMAVETDGRRTSKLTGGPFYDFVEKVRKFALEFMGIVTEDPDPAYWRKRTAA